MLEGLPENPKGAKKSKNLIKDSKSNIPKPPINKKCLQKKNFIRIALRQKSGVAAASKTPKNHVSPVLIAKLTMVDNLYSVYSCLVPSESKKLIHPLFAGSDVKRDIYSGENANAPLRTRVKSVQIIDSNVTVARGKSLKTSLPTFNSLDVAVKELFGVSEYMLIRVTRSAREGNRKSVILKIESAQPGDLSLLDSKESYNEMLASLGKPGETPSNLFINKVVSRPRYKSNAKIYLVSKRIHCSLYLDERMFERDLLNGVIQLGFDNTVDSGETMQVMETRPPRAEATVFGDPRTVNAVDFNNNLIRDFNHSPKVNPYLNPYQPAHARAIYLTIDPNRCLQDYHHLVELSRQMSDDSRENSSAGNEKADARGESCSVTRPPSESNWGNNRPVLPVFRPFNADDESICLPLAETSAWYKTPPMTSLGDVFNQVRPANDIDKGHPAQSEQSQETAG